MTPGKINQMKYKNLGLSNSATQMAELVLTLCLRANRSHEFKLSMPFLIERMKPTEIVKCQTNFPVLLMPPNWNIYDGKFQLSIPCQSYCLLG